MSSSNVQTTYIVQDEGYCGGQPRIVGTRMAVKFIVGEYVHRRRTPVEISDSYPAITLAQVHAALSYYYDNRMEIDRRLLEDMEFAGRMEKERGTFKDRLGLTG